MIAPKPLGVVFTMVQYHAPQPIAAHQYYMEKVRRSITGAKVFNASVRENSAFVRENANGLPVILRGNMVQKFYVELMGLATEFLSHFETRDGSERKRAVA